MTQSYKTIGERYEIRRLIGRGGMAEVHIGSDTRLNRIVAIKILRQDLARDPVFQARFRREAQSAANLNHPSIVAVYDTGEETVTTTDGTQIQVPYIVMEYVEGHTVKELLTDGNPVPIDEAVTIVSGVLDALEYAHHQNLVHRDIKPGNVMITTTGKIKVMDFGIARALTDSQATMTQTDAVVGTAQYLSPEQARGEQVDARSDLYSTGCLLFELLTGQPPFRGDSAVAVAFQHVSQLAPLPSTIAPDIPESLDRVAMKALAKNRNDRYADARSMRDDLRSAEHGGAVTAPVTSSWTMPESAATTVLPPVAPTTRPAPRLDPYSTSAMPPVQMAEQKTSSKKIPIVIGIFVTLLLAGAAFLAWYALGSDRNQTTLVEVPSMAGMTQEEVRAALSELQLQLTLTPGENSEDVPEGLFIKSTPAPGTKVEVGSKVKATFSIGRGETTVPPLAGMTQDQARAALKAAGLTVGSTSSVDSGTAEKDRVVNSNPAAGETLTRGETVDLDIASGNLLIPSDLVGQNIEGLREFVSANRVSLTVTETEDADAEPGTVLELDKAGQLVALGSELRAVVSIQPLAEPELPAEEKPSPAAPAENEPTAEPTKEQTD